MKSGLSPIKLATNINTKAVKLTPAVTRGTLRSPGLKKRSARKPARGGIIRRITSLAFCKKPS
ncbi:MAG: hypothetical protein CL842_02510 [Crocinitomicaceae bacterium]|nr:hypothetical protein [Crocinitomicaceae bacterium]